MTFGRALAIRRVAEFSRTQEFLDVAREFASLAVDGSFAAEVEVGGGIRQKQCRPATRAVVRRIGAAEQGGVLANVKRNPGAKDE